MGIYGNAVHVKNGWLPQIIAVGHHDQLTRGAELRGDIVWEGATRPTQEEALEVAKQRVLSTLEGLFR